MVQGRVRGPAQHLRTDAGACDGLLTLPFEGTHQSLQSGKITGDQAVCRRSPGEVARARRQPRHERLFNWKRFWLLCWLCRPRAEGSRRSAGTRAPPREAGPGTRWACLSLHTAAEGGARGITSSPRSERCLLSFLTPEPVVRNEVPVCFSSRVFEFTPYVLGNGVDPTLHMLTAPMNKAFISTLPHLSPKRNDSLRQRISLKTEIKKKKLSITEVAR